MSLANLRFNKKLGLTIGVLSVGLIIVGYVGMNGI